jgi:hypothetical protein
LTSGNKKEETSGEVACFGNERYGIFSCCYYLSDFKLGSLRTNPFQSNFSANRILPSSYLFWAVKRLVDYVKLSYSFKREKHGETERVQPVLSVG